QAAGWNRGGAGRLVSQNLLRHRDHDRRGLPAGRSAGMGGEGRLARHSRHPAHSTQPAARWKHPLPRLACRLAAFQRDETSSAVWKSATRILVLTEKLKERV